MKFDFSDYVEIILFSMLIFLNLLPNYLATLMMLVLICYRLVIHKKKTIFSKLLFLSIECIPFSYISILGTTTDKFPISWFHVCILSMIAIVFLSSKIKVNNFILFLIFLIYSFSQFFYVQDIIGSLKQLFVILTFLGSFFIIDFSKNDFLVADFLELKKQYLLGTIITSIQVIIQYIAFNKAGLNLGYSTLLGNNRLAFGALFADFSFASLYIATGILMVVLLFFRKKISNSFAIFLALILLTGILTTTARTGLFALFFSVLIYLLFSFFEFSFRKFITIIFALFCTFPIIRILLLKRGSQGLLNSSGRIESYVKSLSVIYENVINFLFGIGLGRGQLELHNIGYMPHNLFIQYHLQMGIIGLLIFLSFFLLYFVNYYKSINYLTWLLLLVFFGSMFIPDIVSSRFLYGVLLISIIPEK